MKSIRDIIHIFRPIYVPIIEKIKMTRLRCKRKHIYHTGKKNPQIEFYVIYRRSAGVGIFSNYLVFLSQIKYAIGKGYIPLIDMQNFANTNLDSSRLHKENAWEYYFEQPMGIGVQEVKKSKNIFFSNGVEAEDSPWKLFQRTFFDDTAEQEIREWHEIAKKHLRPNQKVLDAVEEAAQKLFPAGKRVLGVSCRGTDYWSLQGKDHPKQPGIERVVRDAREVFDAQLCDMIYISTEDACLFKALVDEFGRKAIWYEQQLYQDTNREAIPTYHFDRENDYYLRGFEYVVSKLLLTKCQCLLAGGTSANMAIRIAHDSFDYVKFWNLGFYGTEPEAAVEKNDSDIFSC